jgi:hypothetical protein
MTIASSGYGGYVASEPTWSALTAAFGSEYGVADPSHWRATVVPTADRTIALSAGDGWGRGVRDRSDTAVQKTFDAVSGAAGTPRYDMVLAHRDFAGPGGTTTFTVIKGGTDPIALINSRQRLEVDLTVDDQPLWLVRLEAGSTEIKGLIDVRVWQANAGAVATSELVLQYLTKLGTQVFIGTDLWTRTFGPDGTVVWRKTALQSPINLLAAGLVLDGGPSAPPAGLLMQAGTLALTTDQVGYATVAFPAPFPNGLLSFVAMNGDDSAGNDVSINVAGLPWGTGTKAAVTYRLRGPNGTTRVPLAGFHHRINWMAIGW